MLFILIAVIVGFGTSLYFFPGWENAGITAGICIGVCLLYWLFLAIRTYREEGQGKKDAEIAGKPAQTTEDIAGKRRHYRSTNKA